MADPPPNRSCAGQERKTLQGYERELLIPLEKQVVNLKLANRLKELVENELYSVGTVDMV